VSRLLNRGAWNVALVQDGRKGCIHWSELWTGIYEVKKAGATSEEVCETKYSLDNALRRLSKQ
jgi:hypothetical protein